MIGAFRAACQAFSGANVKGMKSYCVQFIDRTLDTILLYVCTNNLSGDLKADVNISQEIVGLAKHIEYRKINVIVSGLVPLYEIYDPKKVRVNMILRDLCTENNLRCCEHSNLDASKHLNRSRVYSNTSDVIQMLLQDKSIRLLALNETKIDSDYSRDLLKVQGYGFDWLDRNCRGGGVGLYIRDSFAATRREDLPLSDLKVRCLEVKPVQAMPSFVVFCYRSHSAPDETFGKFETALKFLSLRAKKLSCLAIPIEILILQLMAL